MTNTISSFSVLILFSIAYLSFSHVTSDDTGYLIDDWTWHVDGCTLKTQIVASEHGPVIKVNATDLPCLSSDLVTTRLENLIPITLPFAPNSTQEELDAIRGWTFAPFNTRVVDVLIKIIDASTFKLNVGIAGYYESHLGTFVRYNGTAPVFPTYLVGDWKWNFEGCPLNAHIVANGSHTLITVDDKSCLKRDVADLLPVALPFNPNSTKDDIINESDQHILWNGVFVYIGVTGDSTFDFILMLNDGKLTAFFGNFTRINAPAPVPALTSTLALTRTHTLTPNPTPTPVQTSPSTDNFLIGNWTWNVNNCSISSNITAHEGKTILSVSDDVFCLKGHILFMFPMHLPYAANLTEQDVEALSREWIRDPTGLDEFLVYVDVNSDSALTFDLFLKSLSTPGEYYDGSLQRKG